jgi:hypothetical protein
MKRRLVVLSPLAVPIAAARAQSADWQTVVAPDLSFRIEMPAPVAKSTAGEKEKGHANPRVAWESKRDEQNFDFDYVDYDDGWFSSRDSKVMAKELGRGEAEKAFPKDKYKYVRDELVDQQGWDGCGSTSRSGGVMVMMRTYIVKDRLYRLLVTAKADMKTRSAAVRFLESFKLAQARPWTQSFPIVLA